MSETDDTDDLLLIPPDFFVIDSEFEDKFAPAPYYSVVDSLITQVNHLENRINYIETSADNSLSTLSLNSPRESKYKFMSNTRRSISSDDVRKSIEDGFESTQSTPQKPRTIFQLNSLPNTPSTKKHYTKRIRNIDHPCKLKGGDFKRMGNNFSDIKETSESGISQKSKIFSDIDEFISNVNTLKKFSEARNVKKQLWSQGSENSSTVPNLSTIDVDHILSKMENQLEIELMQRGFGIDNKPTAKGNQTKDSLEGLHLNKLSVTSVAEEVPLNADVSLNSESNENTSSSQSQNTVFQNIPQEPLRNAQQVYYNTKFEGNLKTDHFQDIFRNLSQSKESDWERNVKVLSLNDRWNNNESSMSSNSSTFIQKLEEERIKRQHCEDLIRDLQSRILELQEELAVSKEVERTKDGAILKFHDVWEKVAMRLQSLNREKSVLERDINEFQTKSAYDLAEAAKKVAFYEQESSKALNLAHACQEKTSALEKVINDLREELDEVKTINNELSEKERQETDRSANLNKVIAEKETEMNKTRSCLESARQEISQSKKAIDICQAEFINMKTAYTHLELQINDERDRKKKVEEENKMLRMEVERFKKIERDLQDNLQKSKEQNENSKIELRNFYQDQVETVVRDKLKEFQAQLEHAENTLHDELKKRETTIIKSAAIHIQQISEKHQLEIKLLEEKHNEEIRLYHIQLSQQQRNNSELKDKLNYLREYKENISEKLQKVMEAQWHEAIRILNNSKSPGLSHDASLTLDQLNSLKTKSYNNVEQLLNMPRHLVESKKLLEENNPELEFDTTVSSSANDYNKYQHLHFSETPINSREVRTRQQIENDLQKYINVLLNKGNKPSSSKQEDNFKNADTQQDPNALQQSNYDDKQSRRRSNKPPWK